MENEYLKVKEIYSPNVSDIGQVMEIRTNKTSEVQIPGCCPRRMMKFRNGRCNRSNLVSSIVPQHPKKNKLVFIDHL